MVPMYRQGSKQLTSVYQCVGPRDTFFVANNLSFYNAFHIEVLEKEFHNTKVLGQVIRSKVRRAFACNGDKILGLHDLH